MLRTILAAFIAALALLPGEALATRAEDEATHRLAEGVLSVQHDSIPYSATAVGSGQFMLQNPGNLTAFIVGCEDNCRQMRVQLRASGLAPLEVSAAEDEPTSVVIQLPEAYRNSLSNFEVTINVRCSRDRACINRWGALARGAPRIGAPILTPAEWERAGETVRLSNVRWTQRPTSDDLRFFYPVNAWRAGAPGSADLQCVVSSNGALRCRSSRESANGFGDSARKLSSLLRVDVTGEDGASLVGRRILVPIRFQPAGS